MSLFVAVSLIWVSGALGSRFGFGSNYGEDLIFDGMPLNELNDVLDFSYEPYDPFGTHLTSSYSNTTLARTKRQIFRLWPPGSIISTAFTFSIPFPPRGSFEMRFPVVFFINELIGKINSAYGRHSARDQYSMFRSLETGLVEGLAMEGRECVLRAICDAAEVDLAKFSLLGEALAVLLTPKHSQLPEMSDYSRAYRAGRKYGNCRKHYPSCPLSLKSLFPAAWLARKK